VSAHRRSILGKLNENFEEGRLYRMTDECLPRISLCNVFFQSVRRRLLEALAKPAHHRWIVVITTMRASANSHPGSL